MGRSRGGGRCKGATPAFPFPLRFCLGLSCLHGCKLFLVHFNINRPPSYFREILDLPQLKVQSASIHTIVRHDSCITFDENITEEQFLSSL